MYNQKATFVKPATQHRVYYPALDGLRGFSILLVLFSHNFSFITFSKLFDTGVDLFFVLSGFLITDILLKTKKNKKFLQTFYIRRILRIFPIYYLSLVAFLVLAPHFAQLKEQYSYYQNNQIFLWFYLQNWLPIIHPPPFYHTQIFGHFWSLSIEEHFYIVWPFLILAYKKSKALINICLLITSGCIVFRFAT